MKKPKMLMILLMVFAFIPAITCIVKAQTSTESTQTFFDSEVPGIRIQVNATAETEPNENMTVVLSLTGASNVNVEYFNLSMYGFLNGKDRILMSNMTDAGFSLTGDPKEYSCSFTVPEQVVDATYGEINLTHSINLGGFQLRVSNLTLGFTMTYVRNVYFEKLQDDFRNLSDNYNSLNGTYWQLNDNYTQLNQTYQELQQNYTSAQGSLGELDNARRVVAILAITTVFFVATTVFLFMLKPKQQW
jgi:hypothetical protein